MAVYSEGSGEYAMERKEAINKLKQGQIKVIFSVDMFNEGVDIPSVDMVMFCDLLNRRLFSCNN